MGFKKALARLEPRLKVLARRHYYFSGAFDSSDLFQEALINLWQKYASCELEDKNDSYALRSCYFHIKNFIRTHRDNTNILSLDEAVNEESERSHKDLLEVNTANPKDRLCDKLTVEEMLNNGLTKREKDVLRAMLAGLNIREVAKELGISHVRVIKIKDNIRRKYQDKI